MPSNNKSAPFLITINQENSCFLVIEKDGVIGVHAYGDGLWRAMQAAETIAEGASGRLYASQMHRLTYSHDDAAAIAIWLNRRDMGYPNPRKEPKHVDSHS